MDAYRAVQTGPKTQSGGWRALGASVLYHPFTEGAAREARRAPMAIGEPMEAAFRWMG
jgi:hypothetical protein